MSTAPPSGSRTEAQLSSMLELTSDTAPAADNDLGTEFALGKTEQPSTLGLTERESPRSTDAGLTDVGLTDTVAIRLDDTHADILSAHIAHAKVDSLPSVDSTGAVALDPPAANGPLDGAYYLLAKRVVDVVISTVLLVLLSPVLLLAAVLVKLTDGGSVFYPHIRVGKGGNEFTCYKFRSMVVNAEKMKDNLAFFNSHDDDRTFKIPDDPRVTWVGRWMRRTSIDELPQLWNVLRGDMSIVGPRPPVVTEVEQYTWDDMQRLAVKPGLTCIWQVSGRSRLPFPEQLRMDLEYIEKRSLALDLKLIALTVPAVLSADGAY